MDNGTKLRAIKLAHTAIWAFFAGCVLAMPVLALTGRLRLALLLGACVLVEALVVAFSGWHCPITDIAARYTEDRRENFDIYLPEWLARHNIRIFGWLYAAGLAVTAASWLAR